MKKMLVALVMVTLAGMVWAAGDQAFLGVFAETSVTKMIGMPTLPAEILEQMPAAVLEKMGGMANRQLTVRLWSPGIAAADAFATLAIPAGLKLGPKLDLDLYRPEAATGETGAPGEPGGEAAAPAQFTIKLYWGSSPTVKAGQPVVINTKDMTPEEQAAMREQAKKAQAAGSYFYKPDWTTGYWPTEKQPGKIAADAAMPGHYALTTNYTGNVAIDVPTNVSFLAALDFLSPKLTAAPPLDQAIAFKWKAVPSILGYHMRIIGMIGTNTLIIWSSSEIRTGMDVNYDYMQMADVIAGVASTAMMGPARTDCTVPAGIFQDCDMVFLTMIGYGPGTALAQGQPLPRVQTKTTMHMMLGGKKMPTMPAMEGGGDEEMPPAAPEE